MYKKATILLFLFALTSCSDRSEGNVSISVTGQFLQSDNFQLFYNDGYFDSYSESRSIVKKITGSSKIQDIVFILPQNFVPTRVRIDLGENKQQKIIVISKLSICRSNHCKEYNSITLLRQFEFAKGLRYDSKTGVITLTKEGNQIYDPYFISKNLNVVFKSLKD